jgi:hypothetical protein
MARQDVASVLVVALIVGAFASAPTSTYIWQSLHVLIFPSASHEIHEKKSVVEELTSRVKLHYDKIY